MIRDFFTRPEPHEAIVGRRGRWVWDDADEWFGPRGRPERCDEWPDAKGRILLERAAEMARDHPHQAYERAVLLRLTLTMIGVWGLWAVVGGSAYLLFRWLRLACWLTGCSP